MESLKEKIPMIIAVVVAIAICVAILYFFENYESAYFAEELFSNEPAEKSIKVSDRAAIVNFMIGLDGYTISSGIFPKYLQGDEIISIPLEETEIMRIGYIINKDKELSELGQIYIEALKKFK